MIHIEVAEPKDRFVAAAIDFVPPFLLFVLFAVLGWTGLATVSAVLGALYLLCRDVLGQGQSLGKRVVDLQVVDSDTDRVPEVAPMVLRNLGFMVPGLNVVYAMVEGVQVIRHPQGLRYGDIFAGTGVVKVAKEDRPKLLVRPRVFEKKPETAATDPDFAQAEAGADVPAPSGAAKAATLAPPVPARPPKAQPIDLPPESPKAAPVPAAPAGGSSAPTNPGSPGVAKNESDPLKKLIDKAGSPKP